MNLETKITIYKFTPQVFTLTQQNVHCLSLNLCHKYINLDFAKIHSKLKCQA